MKFLVSQAFLLCLSIGSGVALGCSDAIDESANDRAASGGGDGESAGDGDGDAAPSTGGMENEVTGTGGDVPGTGGDSPGTGGTDGDPVIGTVGVQADPGTDGDGTFDHPEPYTPAPETLARADGAPEGTLLGSFFYDSPEVYSDLTFEYWIYVPAQYEPGKPAALMVFQDGSHYVGDSAAFNTPIVFDNLIHEGAMPPTIALFINPGSMSPSGVYQYPEEQQIRSGQYDKPNDVFSQFLIDEAIPELIATEYDIVDDPEGWAISGHSSGGICALMAAWYRPDKFRKVLTHNASFPNTEGVFPQLIEDTDPNLPLRVYLLSSPNDIGGTAAGQWFDTNNQAAAIFEAKGYHYRYLSGTGGHYPPTQSESDYPESLRWLWRGYSLPWYE